MGLKTSICRAAVVPAVMIIVCAASLPAAAGSSRARHALARPAQTEILLEGGLSLPRGDLSDDWIGTEKGLGAETGYDIGFRCRYYLTPRLALSPAFHFDRFGDYTGIHGDYGVFEVRSYILRYGLDLQYMPRRGSNTLVQPYLTAGLAVLYCHYEDEFMELDDLPYESSTNSLGASAGAGLRLDIFEVSFVYNLTRFETAGILGGGLKTDFDWDHIVVRAGLVFPAFFSR